jgi:hypothetical protein
MHSDEVMLTIFKTEGRCCHIPLPKDPSSVTSKELHLKLFVDDDLPRVTLF